MDQGQLRGRCARRPQRRNAPFRTRALWTRRERALGQLCSGGQAGRARQACGSSGHIARDQQALVGGCLFLRKERPSRKATPTQFIVLHGVRVRQGGSRFAVPELDTRRGGGALRVAGHVQVPGSVPSSVPIDALVASRKHSPAGTETIGGSSRDRLISLNPGVTTG